MKRGMTNFARPNMGIEEFDNARATFAPGGETPGVGETFRNPDLARTYRMIAEGGRDDFYEGDLARPLDASFKRLGDWLSYADFARSSYLTSEPQSLLICTYTVF